MKICIVKNWELGVTETFIRAHVERLPAQTVLISGSPPHIADAPPLHHSLARRAFRKIRRTISNVSYEQDHQTSTYARLFSQAQGNIVLAEYRTTGIVVQGACRKLGPPMIVYFYGYDASANHINK